MLGVHPDAEAQSAALAKRKLLLSAAMKRTSEWISSQEVPTDVTVQVGEANFSLHKFPLISKCGYIRKVISEINDPSISLIQIPNIPGGAKAFELVTKFCYGVNFEINLENVAALRCAAEYLEMTDECATGNLINRLEAYLEEIVLMNLPGAITVLHKSEDLLPMSEEIKLVSRCIDAIAYLACNDRQFHMAEKCQENSISSLQQQKDVDWWAEKLTVLRIDTFHRVFMAMKGRGFEQYAFGPIIMLYAQKSLQGLDISGRRRSKKIEPKQQHEKRVVLETVVSLLPATRNAISVSFLSFLLRAAIYLETTIACRLDLEKRIGLQLGQAVLDDLLIPTFSVNDDTIFDIETVKRIFVNYLEYEVETSCFGYNVVDGDFVSPISSNLEQVRSLMESYLSEIASDPNLTITKFVSLAELIPEQARVNEDGMYRAIDIYLKAHPALTEAERKKVCNIMDYQKLSRQACAHAAQNSRLPAQIVVQVLHHEQQRYRGAMTGGALTGEESPALSFKSSRYEGRYQAAPPDELSRLQRENDDLKLELMKMKVQLNEVQKPSVDAAPAVKPPLPKKSVITSLSKKLLSPFMRSDSAKPSAKGRTKPPKDRRHSIS